MKPFSTSRRTWLTGWKNYSRIEDHENSEMIEKSEDAQGHKNLSQRGLSTKSWLFVTGLNTLMLFLTIFNLVFVIPRMTDAEAIKRTQSPSPVFQTSTPTLISTTLNGSLFAYPRRLNREDPSPALDAEWKRVADPGWILVSREDVIALGKDPSTRARASPTLLEGMGFEPDSEMYMAQIDAFHQLHCLNAIRQHSYWDAYFTPYWGPYDAHNPEDFHWTHLSHCFDMLYQNLKCTASADIITSVWVEGQRHPMSDFDITKKCMNFENLLEWHYAHEVPQELAHLMVIPEREEDVETLYPAPLEWYRMLGLEYPKGAVVDHEVPDRRFWYSSW